MSHLLIQMFQGNSSETVWVMQMYIKHHFPPITFKRWGTGVNTDNGRRLSKHSKADCKSDCTDSQTEGSAFNHR